MATNKSRIMVLHEEGTAATIALPSAASPPDLFSALKTRQARAVLANEAANNAATSTPSSAMGVVQMAPILNSAAQSDNQPENLPPESTCKGIKVLLDNNNMWNEFFRCKTEMILTKQGRRMFPYCRFRISGLDPLQKYTLLMDINPVDNKRYKWTGKDWQICGKAEAHVLRRVFIHPDSPSSGHQWMQNPVSFYKLKLTDNNTDQEGNIILHPMHRYLPHLHVVSAETVTKDIHAIESDVISFTFPQTEFFAVTAYQNIRMSQFKADFNPFASGPNSWALKVKTSPLNESKMNESRLPNELKSVKGLNGLKSLMAAKRNSEDISTLEKRPPSGDAQHLTPAKCEKKSHNEFRPMKGLGGLKYLMAKHNSKDTSTLNEGLITSNSQNVTLADCDNYIVNTDQLNSGLKSTSADKINQTPSEPESKKTLNNLQSIMNECTSKDTSTAGQENITFGAQNRIFGDSDKPRVNPSNEFKRDETASANEQKPVKCLNNLKSLMVKRNINDTSVVDQGILSKDAEHVTLVDSDNSGVTANMPGSSGLELKSAPLDELKITENTHLKDFHPLRNNLRYLMEKRNSKDISAVDQGLSCDAKSLALVKSDMSEVSTDCPSLCKKPTPSERKKDEIISHKGCKPGKTTKMCSRGKRRSHKYSAMDGGLTSTDVQTPAVADSEKMSNNKESTVQNNCTTDPPQRKFSEFIRECHLKIMRCNVEIMNTPCNVEQTDTKGMVVKDSLLKASVNDNLGQTIEQTGTQNSRATPDRIKDLLNSSQSPETAKTLVSIHDPSSKDVENSQKAKHSLSVSPEAKSTGPDEQQQGKSKPHKRPEPVPLPLLALYLQQLKSKSRPARTNPKPPFPLPSASSPFSAVPTTDLVIPGPASDSTDQVRDCTDPAIMDPIRYNVPLASDHVVPSTDTADPVLDIVLPTIDISCQSKDISSPNTDYLVPTTDTLLAKHQPVLHTTDPLLLVTEPTVTISLSSSTSSLSTTVMSQIPDQLISSPDSLVPAPVSSSQKSSSEVPVTLNMGSNSTEQSSTPDHDTLILESTSTVPFPCPSLTGFEPSSPASLPDLEPPLPSSFNLKPISAPNIPASSFPVREHLPTSNPFELSSHQSLLGLPPPDPFLTSAFVPLLPSADFNALPFEAASFSSTCEAGSASQDTTRSLPPSDPALSFQVNSEILTRPSTPSPLPFQLSPFSSLGPDPLSPTPSLADLSNFFSISEELEIAEDFQSSDATPVICSPVPSSSTPSVQVSSTKSVGFSQSTKRNKPRRSKKRSKKGLKSTMADPLPVIGGGPTDVIMQPNLEEVEEQLFVSFTSKEALEVHLGDPALCEMTTAQLQKTPEPTKNVETRAERIAAFERVLLGDLKVMKHRQVIHPVLQEVGLKMSLLDPSLVIDLQYLGVRLPLPPPILCPGSSSAGSSQCGSVPYVSRTGKTTDLTQIKGWREKLVPLESPSSKTEGGPSSDVVPKNLSAFCSDMLDEYLANEGKLIDERADSFNQTAAITPVTYQLPTKSTSYVRTLDSVLKKQAPPTTFTPPSKKTRLPLASKGMKKSEKKQQNQRTKQNRLKHTAVSTVTPATFPIESMPLIGHPDPITQDKTTKMRKRKPRVKTPPPPQDSPVLRPNVQGSPHADLAPLEDDNSDPESASPESKVTVPGLTKALLRQRDLEDGVFWEGKHRTGITRARASVALTSLFTLTGFACENPTAPIKMKCRAPPCLNAFCRLGCVCASLAHDRRITHCGKIECIFGCSCLRQKVVVLKNLRGPQFSSSEEDTNRKKRKKRMKMAYTLREAETVSEPAVRVRTLWNHEKDRKKDLEPLYAPTPVYLPWLPLQEGVSAVMRDGKLKKQGSKTCARVRAFQRKTINRPKRKATAPVSPSRKKSSHSQQNSEPSKRLEIVSECKWRSLADRNMVLKIVCEHMAQDTLNNPFWVKGYLIKPVSQSLRTGGESCAVHYKVHITQGPRPDGVAEEHCAEEEWMREEEDQRVDIEERQREEKGRGQERKAVGKKRGLKWKGLPFLSGVSTAGLLTANLMPATSEQEHVVVNGKSYPHAKIQLGRMGAIHPANRLAAYLTGNLQRPVGSEATIAASSIPSDEQPSETLADFDSLRDAKSSTEQSAQLATTITTSVAKVTTTTVPSATPDVAGSKSIVNHLPQTRKVFTQFVVNQIVSSQQRLPPTSSPPKLLGRVPLNIPSTSLVEEASSSSPASSSKGVDGSLPKISASSGGVTSIPTQVVPLAGSNTTVSMRSPPSLPNPSNPVTPPKTTQRLVLQQVRSTSGATLFRKPNGQLIQLVPLSKLQALNPNIVMVNTGGIISLTTPVCLASGSTATLTSTTSQSKSPAIASPSSTYTIISHKATTQNITTTLPVSTLFNTSSISLSPTEANSETYSLKIVSQTGNTEPIIIKCPKVQNQSTLSLSKVLPVAGSHTVLEPLPKTTGITVLSPKNIDTGVQAENISGVDSSVETKVTSAVCSWTPPKRTTAQLPKPNTSPAALKTPVSPQFKFIKANSISTAVPNRNNAIQSQTGVKPPLPILIITPETLLKNSKDNSVSTAVSNLNTLEVVNTHSPSQTKTRPLKQRKELEVVELVEDEDDSSSMDEETDEETDNSSDTQSIDSSVNNEYFSDGLNRKLNISERHNLLERQRRKQLHVLFSKLRECMQLDQKSPKVSVINRATEEIKHLTKKRRKLEKLRYSQKLERTAKVKRMSQLTGESEEQILGNILYLTGLQKTQDLHNSEESGTSSVDDTFMEPEPEPSPSPQPVALSEKSLTQNQESRITQEVPAENVDGRMEVVDLCEGLNDVIEVVDLCEDRDEVIEVVDLLEDRDEEKTDNSSDETEDSEDDRVDRKTKGDVINISDIEESTEVDVDIESVEVGTQDVEESADLPIDILTVKVGSHEKDTKEVENATVSKSIIPVRERRAVFQESLKSLKETLTLDHPSPTNEVVLEQAQKEVLQLKNECASLEKQKKELTDERTVHIKKISQQSGKQEELILQKLQDISTRQKNMAMVSNRTLGGASLTAPSPSPSKTTAPCSTQPPMPKPPVPLLKLKLIHTPVLLPVPLRPKPAPQQIQMTPVATPPSNITPPAWRPASERTRPNILSRRNPLPRPDPPCINSGCAPPKTLSIVGGVIPYKQVITMSPVEHVGSLLPVGRVTGIEMPHSLTPGVASVTISIPSMSQPISLTPPRHILNSGVRHVANVISLVNAPPPQSVPVISEGGNQQLSPVKDVGSGLERGNDLEMQPGPVEVNKNSTPENGDSSEDDTLNSLLSEIVFLNQQMNTDSTNSSGAAPAVTCKQSPDPGQVRTDKVPEPLPEKEIIRPGDDERSLSPLFLRLDEEHQGPKEVKGQEEVTVKSLPHRQDLDVSVEAPLKPFETRSGSNNSAALNGHAPQLQGLACTAKGQGGALTPPPLLQMKVGGGPKGMESNEKPPDALAPPPLVQMRPMPRLTPLGLKSNPQT